MSNKFEPIPGKKPTIEDFPHGYAKNSRNIVPELKFHYSNLKYIPLIQFVNTGKTFDTIFHKIEYEMREIIDYKWSNNIRKIYYYDGARIALPFNCYFIDPINQDFFEISIWKLDGSKQIFNKTIKFKNKYLDSNSSCLAEWYNFILPEEVINEIGITIKSYIDKLSEHI